MPKIIKGGVKVQGRHLTGEPADNLRPIVIGARNNATGDSVETVTAQPVTYAGTDKIAVDIFVAAVANNAEFPVNELPDMAVQADATANESLSRIGANNMVFNGTTWDRMRGDTTNGVKVDVTRMSPGTGATDLGKAEDTPHTSGDVGVFVLGVRRDTLTSLTSANGEYAPFATDQYGQARTSDVGVAATLVDGSQLTGIYDPNSGRVAEVLSSDPAGSEQGLVCRVIPNPLIAQPVNGTVTATQATASNLKGQVQGTNAAGVAPPNPVYIGMKDLTTGFNTAPHTFFSGVFDGQLMLMPDLDLNFLDYSVNGEMRCHGASTDNTKANSRYTKVDSDGNTTNVGSVAHDAADSGNPLKIGGKASTSTPTAVANGDRVDAYFDSEGRQAVFSDRTNPATSCGKTITYVPVSQVATPGTTVLAAASPGNRHKVIGCILTMHAKGTLRFTDGGGNLTGDMTVALDGGFVLPNSIFPYTQTAVNSALSLVTVTGAANGVVVVLTEA